MQPTAVRQQPRLAALCQHHASDESSATKAWTLHGIKHSCTSCCTLLLSADSKPASQCHTAQYRIVRVTKSQPLRQPARDMPTSKGGLRSHSVNQCAMASKGRGPDAGQSSSPCSRHKAISLSSVICNRSHEQHEAATKCQLRIDVRFWRALPAKS